MQETPVWFLGREDPLEKGQATHSSILGLPLGSAGKESACNAGDLGSIPGLGRFPGGGHGKLTPEFLPAESPWTKEQSIYFIYLFLKNWMMTKWQELFQILRVIKQ